LYLEAPFIVLKSGGIKYPVSPPKYSIFNVFSYYYEKLNSKLLKILPICFVYSIPCFSLSYFENQTPRSNTRIEYRILTCAAAALSSCDRLTELKTALFGFLQGREEGGEYWRQACSSCLVTAQGQPLF
jgi:hypothetical protein